jgi:hypothetical protein
MFRFSFHTAFVELDQGGLILKKDDLDIYHKPKRYGLFSPSPTPRHRCIAHDTTTRLPIRFRDSIERDEFGFIVIMEEVEEHMAQLYGEEDAAITATYEQFFQKIVRAPHTPFACCALMLAPFVRFSMSLCRSSIPCSIHTTRVRVYSLSIMIRSIVSTFRF